MKKTSTIVVFVVLMIFFVVSLVAILSARDIPFTQVRLTVLTTWGGTLIALVSSLALLVRAMEDNGPDKLIPLIFPLLGGALVATQHWATAIALALLGIAFIVASLFRRHDDPEPPDPSL